MTIRLNFRWLLVPVLLLSLQLSRAQAPNGTYSFDLGTNDVGTSLWDLTGDYNLDMFVVSHNTETEVQIGSFRVVQDGRGHLSAPPINGDLPNTTGFQIGQNIFGVGIYTIHGIVTGQGGSAEARFILKLNGTAQFGNSDYFPVTITVVADAGVDASSGELFGLKPVKVSVKVKGFPASFSGTDGNFSTPLPPDVTGVWNLTLDLGSIGTATGGTAKLTTWSNRQFSFNVEGHFNPRLGVAQLKLSDAGDDQQVVNGMNFTVLLDSEGNLVGVKGKLFGQKVAF